MTTMCERAGEDFPHAIRNESQLERVLETLLLAATEADIIGDLDEGVITELHDMSVRKMSELGYNCHGITLRLPSGAEFQLQLHVKEPAHPLPDYWDECDACGEAYRSDEDPTKCPHCGEDVG